ncbi:MAG TPA: flagellar hook assembly protein FlgD [Gammaproteobacteria bacterium]|nr:flagellar hook assembly protein FlgD [Gammaproteobacteria bacterium]
MSHVDDVSLMNDLGLSRPKPERKKDELGQEDFLKLLTTQLSNQDPFKPMENGDFLAQIAQFASVSGIQDLQNSLAELSTALTGNQGLQAADMVGRRVISEGSRVMFDGVDSVGAAVELPASSQQVTVGVYSSSGELVRTLSFGAQGAGVMEFQWDGLSEEGQAVPPGRYELRAEALYDGQRTALSTRVASRVASVTLGEGGRSVSLNLDSGESLAMKDVKAIL